MTDWRGHSGDPLWHDGAESAGSFVTLCHGRWPLSSEREGIVEHSDSPADEEQCDACKRVRADIERVEQGLLEFRESATYDWPRARRTFDIDLGGES